MWKLESSLVQIKSSKTIIMITIHAFFNWTFAQNFVTSSWSSIRTISPKTVKILYEWFYIRTVTLMTHKRHLTKCLLTMPVSRILSLGILYFEVHAFLNYLEYHTLTAFHTDVRIAGGGCYRQVPVTTHTSPRGLHTSTTTLAAKKLIVSCICCHLWTNDLTHV